MPLKKEISAVTVLITQLGPDRCGRLCTDVESWSGSSVTGTIVNLFVGIRMAPPLVDTFIVPEVPNCLYALFDYGLTQGSGGCSNMAGMKIQLECDLLSGQFLNVQPGHGKNHDKTYGTDCLESIEPGNLFLRDLGYFDLRDLQTIHEKEAYYISRLKLNTRIYFKNPEPAYFKNGT